MIIQSGIVNVISDISDSFSHIVIIFTTDTIHVAVPDKRETVQVIRLSPRLRTKNNSASVDSDPFSSDFEHLIGDDDYLSGSVISADLDSLDWEQNSSVDDIVPEEDNTSDKADDREEAELEPPQEVIAREVSRESTEVFEPERLPPFPPPSPAEVRVSPTPSTPSPPPPLLPPTPPPPFVPPLNDHHDLGLEHDPLSSDDDTFQVSSYQSSLTPSSAVSHVTSTDTIPYIDDGASARTESTGSRDSTPIPPEETDDHDDNSVTPPDDDQQYSYSLSRRNNARVRVASHENVDIVRYTIATAAAQKTAENGVDDHRSSEENRSNGYKKKDEVRDTLMVT